VRRLCHGDVDLQVVVEAQEHGLGAGDGAEHRHHEVREAVAVAVERGDDERQLGGPADEPRVRRVDQDRLVGHVRVALRRCVELLLEHALVHGRHRPLRTAVDLAPHLLGRAERVLGDHAARRAGDLLRPERDLLAGALVTLPPLLGAVGVLDGHPHDGDREVHARDRRHAGDPATGADDHLPADLLAQDAVGGADVVLALGRDRGRLDAEAGLAHGARGVVDDLVAGRAPLLEREVEALQLDVDADDARVEHPERLLEQLLAGFVALQDGDGERHEQAR
jgi:hypothetical protein